MSDPATLFLIFKGTQKKKKRPAAPPQGAVDDEDERKRRRGRAALFDEGINPTGPQGILTQAQTSRRQLAGF